MCDHASLDGRVQQYMSWSKTFPLTISSSWQSYPNHVHVYVASGPVGALRYSRWFLENYQMFKEYSCNFLFLRYSRYSWQDCSGKSRIIFLTFSDDNWIFLKTFEQNYMYLCKIILLPPFFILSLPLSRCPESKTLLYNQWTKKRQHCDYMIVVCIVIQESDK